MIKEHNEIIKQDDCDIYSTDMAEFMLKVDNELSVEVIPQHDQNTNVYYILTGNATFTKMGLELYHILKKKANIPGENRGCNAQIKRMNRIHTMASIVSVGR